LVRWARLICSSHVGWLTAALGPSCHGSKSSSHINPPPRFDASLRYGLSLHFLPNPGVWVELHPLLHAVRPLADASLPRCRSVYATRSAHRPAHQRSNDGTGERKPELSETLSEMNGRHSGDTHHMRVTALVCDGTVPSHPFQASRCLSALKVVLPAAGRKNESLGPGRLSLLAKTITTETFCCSP
jgi:hypothetical protein